MNRQTSKNHYRKPASEKACGKGGFYVYSLNYAGFRKRHGESTPRLAAALTGNGKTQIGPKRCANSVPALTRNEVEFRLGY